MIAAKGQLSIDVSSKLQSEIESISLLSIPERWQSPNLPTFLKLPSEAIVTATESAISFLLKWNKLFFQSSPNENIEHKYQQQFYLCIEITHNVHLGQNNLDINTTIVESAPSSITGE